jgi:glycerol-3-phosphate dehydrogenase (NAD(P)+)
MNDGILVVGAGAWGTALAIHCARAGRPVTLWARNPAFPGGINPRLPGAALPASITVTSRLPAAAAITLLATPMQHTRAALAMDLPDAPVVLCMKGLEAATALFPLELLQSLRPGPAAVLTGPNFAHEVAAGLPAAAIVACADPALRQFVMGWVGTREFRLYGSADPIGAQVGGAAKNVIAIAAGVAIAAGLGENARAAVVTRGLAEIGRLAEALGGRVATVAGLSGLGDLMLTCTGAASRNYRLGLAIGGGASPAAARRSIAAAVEGMDAAPALLARAQRLTPPAACPVTAAVAAVLAAEMTVAEALASVLARPEREE